MAPKGSKTAKTTPKPQAPPKEYPTIAAQLEDVYLSSRPYLTLASTKGLAKLSPNEKSAYALSRFLETGAWKAWPEASQAEFWKAVDAQKIPIPLPPPRDLGTDKRGRDIGTYTPAEYQEYVRRQAEIEGLKEKSRDFKEQRRRIVEEKICGKGFDQAVDEERNRRKFIGVLEGKKMGRYEADPEWDDVIPIAQDDGEGALAAIAYTDEYSEAMGYLRAIMASKEHTPRVLTLTEHIISMNPAHYTVWLYRASTIFALDSPVADELEWVNSVALEHQKNYQIWHHRQILIDHLYPSISSSPDEIQKLAESETVFMTEMFDEDAKNYHVWSYRQYLVRKLNLFGEAELKSIEALLKSDVRNNSAWSHRFFVVFSDPEHSTPGSKATEHDQNIPSEIVDRELSFAQAATYEAPQNQSPWNYIRGVLRKGGRELGSLEEFALEFVRMPQPDQEEEVKSSHALDFLADVWSEGGSEEKKKADLALSLLGFKYDRVRKNYWEWRRRALAEVGATKGVEEVVVATKGMEELAV